MIYSNDIARVAHALEQLMLNAENASYSESELYENISQTHSFITQPATQEVELPDFSLPCYEGFNRYGQRSWLGLHRRDEQFPISFLLNICTLCLETRVGEICTTPCKSLIIKGIEEKARPEWSRVLGRHNINVRHAANELAWQTEDHDAAGMELKKYILRYFEKHDTRTSGLCFGVQTRDKSEVFGSILICKRPTVKLGKLSLLSVYDLNFTENYNPNSRTYFPFETSLMKNHLPIQLDRLCRKFNTSRHTSKAAISEAIEKPVVPLQHEQYHCPHCLTAYDEAYGDERAEIAPGVPFADLSEKYLCPTCDPPKSEFVKRETEEVTA